MTHIEEFKINLSKALESLNEDEWAVVSARENAIKNVNSVMAFESIIPVLNLALEQTDEYAFESCCILALQFAAIADTTEHPLNLEITLNSLRKHQHKISSNLNSALNEIEKWFRVTST